MLLTKLRTGQSAIIKEIVGGRGVVNRLYSLGIVPGKKITKVSSMVMRGPVVIRVDSTEIALGYGMADKILVDSQRTTVKSLTKSIFVRLRRIIRKSDFHRFSTLGKSDFRF